MNISDVVNDIKLTQGLNTIALPFDKPIELVIQEIIKTSVRTFSQFKPYIREGYEEKKNLRSPSEFDKKREIYILPESLTITPVQTADAFAASNQFQPTEASTNAFTGKGWNK